jgi:hypothetical protein
MVGVTTGRLPILGVDIGGVITGSTGGVTGEDTFFGSRPMDAPEIPGAIDALRDLTERFDYRVWLVSKAGPRVSRISRAWLEHVGFWARTGIVRGNLEFVGERHEKAPVCERLGVTHFVDDRLDVLEHLRPVVPRLYWLKVVDGSSAPRWMAAKCGSWPEMRLKIVDDLHRME